MFIRVHPWLKMPKLIFAFFAFFAVKPVRVADAVIGVPGVAKLVRLFGGRSSERGVLVFRENCIRAARRQDD